MWLKLQTLTGDGMEAQRLVEMVNDIAAFFSSDPDPVAASDGVAQHVRRFWDPRMRAAILEHLQTADGEGLSPIARAAIVQLGTMTTAKAS
jgi:formate dehydrogenase subunit delta